LVSLLVNEELRQIQTRLEQYKKCLFHVQRKKLEDSWDV